MIPPIYTSRSEYTDDPETVGAPVAGLTTIDSLFKSIENSSALDETIAKLKDLMGLRFSSAVKHDILPKFNAIFSLQKDILSQLPLEKFYAYDQDKLEDVFLDIFYPIDNPEFIKNFNSHLDLKNNAHLPPLFRERIAYYLKPHLIALKAYSEVKPYLNERPQPKTFRDIYPILGKYLKENPDQVETLFDAETIQSGVGKKLDLSDDLYATLLCRTMANPEKKPSDIINELDSVLEERLISAACPNTNEIQATIQQQIFEIFQKEAMSQQSKAFDSGWVKKTLAKIFEESKTAYQASQRSPRTFIILKNFSVTLHPDLKLILFLGGKNFGTLQVLPPNTSLGLKFDSSLSCATWFKLVEKQKTYAQFVIALEFSKDSQWHQNAKNLEKLLNYFPNVEQLHLPHFDFQNNSILTRISNLKNLRNLNVEGCQFGEFTGFGKADALQKVNLSKTNVCEKRVADLAGSRFLEITVKECNHLKEEGLKNLRAQFPNSFFYS